MTREQKLAYHLEGIIWASFPEGTRLKKRQLEELIAAATPEQREAAYQRALWCSPVLLDDEAEPQP